MTLEEATACCPYLAAGVQPSLQAVPAGHRDLIAIGNPRRLQHSLNLEAVLSRMEPRMKQWDYAIGWESHSGMPSCCFAEVHPANTGGAEELICKKRDVEAWLSRYAQPVIALARRTAQRLDAPSWHWLATPAPIAIRRGSQAAKRLAAAGISGPKRRLQLD